MDIMCLAFLIAFGCFRPLIRGFFFYTNSSLTDTYVGEKSFPSPHSGILFLYSSVVGRFLQSLNCFRPLIRGFFFYTVTFMHDKRNYPFVSVPSFGDSFFIPCRYDMPPSLNIFAIFRRILHFLAQKGSPLTQSIHFSPYPSASARIKSFFHPYCTVSNSS